MDKPMDEPELMEAEIKLPKVKCPLCNYEWIPRSPKPRQCPSCRKYIPRRKKPVKCYRCGYEWIPRVDKPKVCRKCRAPLYHLPEHVAEILNKVLSEEGATDVGPNL
jgi:hypothetical protein